MPSNSVFVSAWDVQGAATNETVVAGWLLQGQTAAAAVLQLPLTSAANNLYGASGTVALTDGVYDIQGRSCTAVTTAAFYAAATVAGSARILRSAYAEQGGPILFLGNWCVNTGTGFASVASVSGSVGTAAGILGVTFPTNFGIMEIDASGRVDVSKFIGNAATVDGNGYLNINVKDYGGTATTSMPFGGTSIAANNLSALATSAQADLILMGQTNQATAAQVAQLLANALLNNSNLANVTLGEINALANFACMIVGSGSSAAFTAPALANAPGGTTYDETTNVEIS